MILRGPRRQADQVNWHSGVAQVFEAKHNGAVCNMNGDIKMENNYV